MSLFDTDIVSKPMYYFDEPGTHRLITDMASEIESYLNMYEKSIPDREKTYDFFRYHFKQIGNIIRTIYALFSNGTKLESYNPDIFFLMDYHNIIGEHEGVTRDDPNLYLENDNGRIRLLFCFEMYMYRNLYNDGDRVRKITFEISNDLKHVFVREAKFVEFVNPY